MAVFSGPDAPGPEGVPASPVEAALALVRPDELSPRDALALDPEWLPHAMVVIGRPDPAYVGRPRPPVPLADLRAFLAVAVATFAAVVVPRTPCDAAGTVIVGSGLAAVSVALLSCLKAGDHLLVTDSVYRPTRMFCDGMLKRYGITTTYYDPLIGAGIAGINGRVQEALQDFQEAHKIFQAVGAARSQAIALQNIGSIYNDAVEGLDDKTARRLIEDLSEFAAHTAQVAA